MLDRLFDFLRDFIGLFKCAVVVDQYEIGLVLRLGKLHKIMEKPGFYWLAPFYIDRAMTDTCVLTARDLPMQSVTLADGTTVAVGPVVSFKTNDAQKFFLEVDNAEAVLRDSARGTIREVLSAMTWDQVADPNGAALDELTKAVRKQAWRFGIEVTQVKLADLSKARTLRLITGG